MPKLHSDVRKYYLFRALLKRFALPVLILFGLDQGLSLEQLAFIGVIASVVQFLLEIPSGAVADTLGHKRSLVISMVLQALSMALYLGGTLTAILAATVLYFAACTLMTGTSEALFYERVKELGLEKEHGKLYGQGKGFAMAISVVSMALAGVLYGIAWYLPFVIGVVQFLIGAVVIGSFGPAQQARSVARSEGLVSFFAHFGEAARVTIRNPRVFWLIISSALVIAPLFALADYQQAIMSNAGMSAAIIGFIYAAKRLLSVFAQALTYKFAEIFDAPTLTLVAAVISVVHVIAVGVVDNPYVLVGALLLGSIGWVVLEVARNDFLNRAIETKSRATALSIGAFAERLVMLLTTAAFGALSSVSAEYAYVIIGIGLTAVLVVPISALFRAYR